jgi:bifunctional DNA-binding transcriptional regulator/antitoxin component of YhaV-PrlF toxin-antitoxin module
MSLRKRYGINPGTFLRFNEDENAFQVVPALQGITSLRGKIVVTGPQDFKQARQDAIEERINEKTTRD